MNKALMPSQSSYHVPKTYVKDRFVLDGSVTLAWLFHDEQDVYADAIVTRLPNVEMLVPRLWHLEVANVLVVSERRERCTQADARKWFGFLSGLPITVDSATERQAWSDTVALARQHRLTVYDAAYLELSIRKQLPIATLDRQLKSAALAIGVAWFQP